MTDQDPTRPYEPPTAAPQPPVAPPAAGEQAAPAPPAPPAPSPAISSAPVAPPAPVAFAAPEAADAAPEAVATAPVSATAKGRSGKGRLRWLVAGILVLLVAGTAAGATLLLTGDSGTADVLAWTPADSLIYGEARLDLPGDQGAELAALMKAFPGFDDQAAFGTKLSEALDQVVGKASDGKYTWKTDIEPWFGGQVAGSIGAFPTLKDPAAGRALVILSVKDAAAAKTWADRLVKDAGGTTSTETYNGATITLVTPPADAPAEMGDIKGGYVLVGPVLALGDAESLKAVVDTKGTAGLPSNAQFKEASASIKGDHLGFAYYDYRTLLGRLSSLTESLDGVADMSLPQSILDQMPAWTVASFRAEQSAFVVDATAPHSDLSGTGSASKLPGLVPSGTLVLASGHDFGAQLKRIKDLYGDVGQFKDAIKQIDDTLAILGGFDAVTGWMGESGIAIAKSGDSVTGGIVVVPTDTAAAERLFNQLKGFIQLGGGDAGITLTEEDYKGTPITIVDLSALGGLAGSMAEGVDIPTELKISYAVTDGVVVLGYGTDFTKAVLDAAAGGASLAGDARFGDAISRVGATRTGLVWVDIKGIRDVVEPLLPSDAKTPYEADVKPYLDAFDYLIQTTEPGQQYDLGRVVLHVAGN